MELTRQQIERFRADGFLLLRDFYDAEADVLPIGEAIGEIIALVARRHGMPQSAPEEAQPFDLGFMDLIAANRRYGGEVYDAAKHIPAFQRLVADKRHEALFAQLRADALPAIASGGSGVRIDIPHEDRFRANWHQEYPAQLRSLDGIVFWSPLVPVDESLGPVEICVGSHRAGPLPVLTSDRQNPQKSGAYSLVLADEDDVLSGYETVAPTTRPGDLLLMDFLLLHASGVNRGQSPRWTMQFRYFNFREPVGLRHGWSGSFAAGVDFRDVHPELCADEPQP